MHSIDWLHAEVAAKSDWTIGELDLLTPFQTDRPDDVSRLQQFGITLSNNSHQADRSSVVYVGADCKDLSVAINLGRSSGNVLVFCNGSRLRGSVLMEAGANLFICRHSHPNYFQVMDVNIRGNECAFYFGKGSTSHGLKCSIEGSGKHVIIGDDCLISEQVRIFETDHHSIVDLDTGLVVNEPDSIHIRDHVWLGLGAIVLKGVTIGTGSIVGGFTVVGSDVPSWSAVAGVPARTTRSSVSWARTPPTMMAGATWKMGDGYTFERVID